MLNFLEFENEEFLIPKEDICIEYKTCENELPKTFWETYSAFANTNGGIIVLGVKELNHGGPYKITGVKNPTKIKTDLWNAVHNKQKVSSNIIDTDDVIELTFFGKKVIQVRVREAGHEKKPIYIDNNRGKSFTRTDDGDRKLTDEQYKYLIVDSRNNIDTELLENYDINDLNLDTVNEYRKLMIENTGNTDLESVSEFEFLCNIGVFKKDRNKGDGNYYLTTGGLLFFGKYNSIIDRFNKFQLDYFKKKSSLDTDWLDRVSTGDMNFPELNIFSFYKIVLEKMKLNVPDKYIQTQELTRGSYRADLLLSWKEALVNSLMHAYFDGEKPIKIVDYDDYVEFYNPGFMKVSKEEFIHGSYSVARNPIIANLFRKVGIAEKAASGGPRIFDSASKYHLRVPDIINDFESTKIQIWKVDLIESFKELNEIEIEIIKLIMDSPFMKFKEIKENFPNSSEYKIRNILYELVDKKYISITGQGRSTAYIVNRNQEAGIVGFKRILKRIESDLYN